VHRGLNAAGVAAGPMQFCVVRPCGGTWQQYGVNGDPNPRRSVYAIGDAAFTAARYLRVLEHLVGTRPRSILAAYNAGPGNVQRYHGVPPFSETRVYVERGEALMQRL
jgi:soluble lytic murein transglycosylase-like protein